VSYFTDFYSSTGHPLRAQCGIRHNRTFVTYCREIWYGDHSVDGC
jgi:hypothetical protein